MNTYIHCITTGIFFYLSIVTEESYKKGLWVKIQNSNDLMVLTYLPLLTHNSSEDFKKTSLLMYRTFGLLREHGGTDKLCTLLVFLICVIVLLTEPEDEFLSELSISSFQNAKSPSPGKHSAPSLSIWFH